MSGGSWFWPLLAILCHTLARSVHLPLHFTFMRLLHFTFTAIVSFNVYAHCKLRLSPAFGARVDFEFILIEVLTRTVASPASPDQFDQEA